MKSKYFKSIMVFILCITLLAGCTSSTANTQSVQNEGDMTIVTSFYPIYIATMNVAKDIQNVKVVNMTKEQTGCLHDYQLTTGDLKTLESAQVFVINGAGMEAFMEKVIKQMPKLKIIEAAKGIEMISDEEHGELNPHIWVGVSGAIAEVKNIAEQLSTIDPKNSSVYKKNADEYIKKLEALKEKMHTEIDKLPNRSIITFHEAFPYFAKEFNLNIVAVIEREPGAEPSAGELADTIKIVKDNGVKALFAEPQYPTKAAETIAKETGAKVYVLDPFVTGGTDYDAYIKVMESNMEQLREALK